MTVDDAILDLRRQSIERGLGGRLEDFDVYLCEDRRTVSVFAFYGQERPLMAQFDLGAAIDSESFSNRPVYDRLEAEAARAEAKLMNAGRTPH
jgi:hypothetical protein